MEKYTIKINKKQENGEKTFVILEKRVKDPLQKYEDKMKRYRNNVLRKLKAKEEADKRDKELYEVVEETINKKVKIVTSKPNASKGTKTDVVFEWTPEAKAAKATLANQKITQTIEYTDKDGNVHTRTIRRHPKLSELTFTKKVPNKVNEDNKERRKAEKASKKVRLENRNFSDTHNMLINSLLGKPNNYLKQAAEEAKHETVIQKLIKAIRERKLAKMKYRLEFRKFKDGSPQAFMVYHTSHSDKQLPLLEDICSKLANRCAKEVSDFISINIYDNKTNKLLRIFTDYQPDQKDYEIKLNKLKAIYPEYYSAA